MKTTKTLKPAQLSPGNSGFPTVGRNLKQFLTVSVAALLALSAGTAGAQLSYTLAADGLPSASSPALDNLNLPSPAILTLSGNAYLQTGSSAQGSTPFFYGSTASYFGEPADQNSFDASQYVAVDIGGSATLGFSTPRTSLGLNWGSVDPGNVLTFYDNNNNVIGSISGSDFDGAISSFNPWNTIYVNITSATPFLSVVATTTDPGAFEFDDVAYAPVPEPTSLVLVGAGFAMLGFILKRRAA